MLAHNSVSFVCMGLYFLSVPRVPRGRFTHFGNSPRDGSKNFKKALTEIAMVDFICFLCYRKANNDAYTLVP